MSDIAASNASPSIRPVLWNRVASLLGILPLGVWTLNHLWDNLSAFSGDTAWEESVTGGTPIAHTATLVMVFVPLILHTVWGLQRLKSSRPNNIRYSTYDNLKYLFQRLSAIGLLGFLVAHTFLALIKPRYLADPGHPEKFSDIAAHMHWHPPTLVVYLLGTLAVSYHLANGISGFAWTFGLVSGRRTYRGFDKVMWVSLIVMLAMAWGAIYALYTAGAAFPKVD